MEQNIIHSNVLELDKVLSRLASRAALDDAKAAALALVPSTDEATVNALLAETDDAYKLMAGFGSPSFGSASDVSGALRRAEAGAALSCAELLKIAEVLRVVRSLKEWHSHCENSSSPSIDGYFAALVPNRYFEDRIGAAIVSEDELSDNASPALHDIRRKIHSSELNVRDRLEKMVRSSSMSKYLRDAIITQRDGRYCIPVRAEYRSEVPGLLHDTSSSGATLFIEPMAIVEINNAIRELLSKESEEIERILLELSGEAAGFAENIRTSYSALVSLSLIFAKASLAFDMQASRPQINTDGLIYLKNARHPLLDRKKAVPVTIPLGGDYDTLIITGPNTGGKTVTIKTVGLLTLMTMCGLMIPVSDGSFVSVFDNILADIGDEQSIEQSLSTFSAHMKRIVSILSAADTRSLVLIDELGAGTDPVEGAALATAILEELRLKGAKIAATTHYAELKTYALETPGVCNASCEFDVATLMPTYKLIIGMPGRSNAFAISQRLGLDAHIIDRAKALVDDEDARFEHIVAKLEDKVRSAESDRAEADRLRSQLIQEKAELDRRLHEADMLREKAAEKAREQASALVDKARNEAERLLAEMESLKRSETDANERIRKARAAFKSGVGRMQDAADPVNDNGNGGYVLPRSLKKGDKVELIDIRKQAEVLEDQTGDEVLILAGIIKTRVPASRLRLIDKSKGTPAKTRTMRRSAVPEKTVRTAKSEIDIRGLTGDEAALELDRFIDNSVMAGLSTVWIIHGKGTGALKKAVRDYLKSNKSVVSFRPGVYGEGEDGVTVAELA